MDYKYGRLSLPVQDVDYKREPLLQSTGNKSMSLLALVEVNGGQWRPWGHKKVKLYSFLVGLTVAFLITASYILNADKKDLMMTPSPYLFQVVSNTGHHPNNLTFVRDYASVKEEVKSIVTKVEFSHRRVPDLKDLLKNEPHIFSHIPHKFLTSIKNPCWYEEHTGKATDDPYGKNMYGLYSRRSQAIYKYLRNSLKEHLYKKGGKWYRLRCLPYFYIMGQPKCGTTDLYNRLRRHPDVRFTTMKEPHWWTRKRFGIIRLSDGFHARYPMKDYLDLFDLAALQIHENLLGNRSKGPAERDIIIGEASASTMWDNNAWVYFYHNGTEDEPPFLVQDFIHAVQPDAKFIVMLRDPVERLYSDYLYFGMANKSVEDFHERVSESLQLFEACLSESSLRSCVYNTSLNAAMSVRLQVGLYVAYLLDWLSVYSKDQILVLRLEDHAANCKKTMNKVFRFLSLGSLSEEEQAEITKTPASNTRRPADLNLGPMLPVTRDILQQFYWPYNERLAKMLQDKAFLWTQP